MGSEKVDVKMEPSKMIWEGQEKLVYEAMCSEAAKGPMLQRLRTTTLTVEHIMSLIQKKQQEKAAAEQSEEEDSDRDSKASEHPPGDAAAASSAKANLPPVLTSLTCEPVAKRGVKKSAPGGPGQRPFTKESLELAGMLSTVPSNSGDFEDHSDRQSQAGSAVDSLAASEAGAGKKDSAARHIQKLNLTEIMKCKAKYGVQLRFAELYLEKCRENNLDTEVFPLSSHLELASAAMFIAETDLSKANPAEVDDRLEKLKSAEGVWPASMQWLLMNRAVARLADLNEGCSEEDVKARLDVLTPRGAEHQEGQL